MDEKDLKSSNNVTAEDLGVDSAGSIIHNRILGQVLRIRLIVFTRNGAQHYQCHQHPKFQTLFHYMFFVSFAKHFAVQRYNFFLNCARNLCFFGRRYVLFVH